MWKKYLLILVLIFSFAFTSYANDEGWVYYGTSDDGFQLFYNRDLVSQGQDPGDKRKVLLTWIAAQNPKLKYVDTMFYVGFKDDPEEFAYLAEIHCTKEGKITKQEIQKKPTWENTTDANLMHFLHTQVAVIARINQVVQAGFQSGVEGQKNHEIPTGVVSQNSQGIPAASGKHEQSVRGNKGTVVPTKTNYIGDVRTMRFHILRCRWAKKIAAGNRADFASRREAIQKGFTPCKVCRP